MLELGKLGDGCAAKWWSHGLSDAGAEPRTNEARPFRHSADPENSSLLLVNRRTLEGFCLALFQAVRQRQS